MSDWLVEALVFGVSCGVVTGAALFLAWVYRRNGRH